jgi:hypothetical protein
MSLRARSRFVTLAATLAAIPAPALAAGARWSVDVEAVQLALAGHDRTVLLDRATDFGPPAAETATGVELESDDALAYRGELRWTPGRWSFGLDFLSHRTNQDAPLHTGAVGGAIDRRTFVVGGGEVVADAPGELLYYERLEDTTVELWSLDLFAGLPLAEGDRGELRLLFGLRAADFDNDYRAVTGLGEVGGLRLDASSNYDRMHGPVAGLAGRIVRGRHRFEGHLAQAIVWGDVELTSGVREFVGPPSRDVDHVPGVVGETRFKTTDSVSIPMTELRLRWRVRFGGRFEAGLGAFGSRWWDVAVPPGVDAGSSLDTLAESTIDSYGFSAGVGVVF